MPLGPEEISGIIAAIVGAFGGGLGVAKLHSGRPSRPAIEEGDSSSATALISIGEKVDGVGRQVASLHNSVQSLLKDSDLATHRLDRIEREIAPIHGRLVVLESRQPPKL